MNRLLKGKTIEYDPEVFPIFSKKLSNIYLIEKKKKEAVIENRIWEKNKETEFATFDDLRKIENYVILRHDKKAITQDLAPNLVLFFSRYTSTNIFPFSSNNTYVTKSLH